MTVYDPVAIEQAKAEHPELGYATSIAGAADGADVLLVLTDWPEFARADPRRLAALVSRRSVVDGRGVLDPGAGPRPTGSTAGSASPPRRRTALHRPPGGLGWPGCRSQPT